MTESLLDGHMALYPHKIGLLGEYYSVNIDICEIVDLVSDERVEHVCEVGFNAGKMRWRWLIS